MEEKASRLSIDLGMTTGFVISEAMVTPNDPIIYANGVQKFKRKPSNEPQSYVRFCNWMTAHMRDNNVREVIYEECVGNWKGNNAATYYYGFRGVMLLVAESFDCKIWSYTPMTIKKCILGSGKADKLDGLLAMRRRFPQLKFDTDDASDAMMLLLHHLNQIKSCGLS